MWYNIILYSIILYHIILYYITLYYIISHYIILYYIISHYIILYHIILYYCLYDKNCLIIPFLLRYRRLANEDFIGKKSFHWTKFSNAGRADKSLRFKCCYLVRWLLTKMEKNTTYRVSRSRFFKLCLSRDHTLGW